MGIVAISLSRICVRLLECKEQTKHQCYWIKRCATFWQEWIYEVVFLVAAGIICFRRLYHFGILDAMSWMCQFQVLVEVSNILNEAHAGKYLWLAVSIHQSIPGVTVFPCADTRTGPKVLNMPAKRKNSSTLPVIATNGCGNHDWLVLFLA